MSDVMTEFPHLATAEPALLMDRLVELRRLLTNVTPETLPQAEELRLLREMSVIAGTLRRRTAGPPKEAKPKGKRAAPKTLDDIA